MSLFFAAVAGAVVLAAVLAAWRARRKDRKLEVPDRALLVSYSGNFRYPGNGGGSGRLEFFSWGIRLSSVAVLRPITPVIEVRYEDLTEARLVSARINRGVRLRAASVPHVMTFVSYKSDEIADRLQSLGVAVERNADRLRGYI